MEILAKKFNSSRQLTTYITKTLKDNGFKRFEKIQSENSAMIYLSEKEYVFGTSYIIVGGLNSIVEAKQIKENLDNFFEFIFGDNNKCVSNIRETFIDGKQVYTNMHKNLLSEETLGTVRFDLVIYKNVWKYWNFLK